LDDNFQVWLANVTLLEFLPQSHVARVSIIFKWYVDDFRRDGGSVEAFLARYRPETKAAFDVKTFKLEYKTYNWGLTDNSNWGTSYSQIRFLWDYFWNK
jgi:hypothetical protein